MNGSISNKPSTFRFLHASDLHLGAKQYQNLDLAQDYIDRLKNIFGLAIMKKVDCILLSGDVFTSIDILPGLFHQIIALFQHFQQSYHRPIPILAIEGNHDLRRHTHGSTYQRGQSWLKVLSKLGLLYLLDFQDVNGKPKFYHEIDGKKECTEFIIKFVRIFGTHYTNQTPTDHIKAIAQSISKEPEKYSILLQHFGIHGTMEGVPGIRYSNLISLHQKIDYLALGHFHKGYQIKDWIYNPGSPEAVSLSEHRYPRGIFYGQIIKTNSHISQEIVRIRLPNRAFKWVVLHFPRSFYTEAELLQWVRNKLQKEFFFLTISKQPVEKEEFPILYLKLQGIKPHKALKIKKREIAAALINDFPVIAVRIFTKFQIQTTTIDKFIRPRLKIG
jgi:DNA repair exonuclease SbcCD nuclease subunit